MLIVTLAMRSATCPGATFRSLRHATEAMLLEQGVPMRVVSDLLGHSSTRVTSGICSHVTARLVDLASDAIREALG
jgi:integrase